MKIGPAPRPTLLLAGALATAALVLGSAAPSRAAGTTIAWRPWGRAAFSEAQRTGRLVLLHVTATWSHACHAMDHEAWADSATVGVVDSFYVPVRVDGDRRPDVAERYLAGGWPTTAVLTHDGQVLVAEGVIGPVAVRAMLRQMYDLYRRDRTEVDRRAAESARRVAHTWVSEALPAPDMPLDEWIGKNLDAVRQAEDRTNGGFGQSPKLPQFESISFLLAEAAARTDGPSRDLAFRALDGALHLEDRLWGGFFRFAGDADWKKPHTEKLLAANASALGALVSAVDAGGGARYRDAAKRTEGYAATWLWDAKRGGWLASQDADLLQRAGGGEPLAGEVYYGLGDRLRHEQGIPAVDSVFLADANARMASAVLRGAASGLWKGAAVARALRALDRLWSFQRAPDGSFYHSWERGRAETPGLLADQAAAGAAYLDAYAATKDRKQRTRAEAVAQWIRGHLEDRVAGGFRFAPRDSAAVGRLLAGDKPEAANAEAATLFARLYEIGGREEDLRSAQRALDWLRSGDVLALDPVRAELGLRIEAIERGGKPPR
ncbi:MAG TPA: DUF255 domain-containing protein [Candidatus Eisenbacteria bacterium]